MTDNEIIKALECYKGFRLAPYDNYKEGEKCIIVDDALDLINRQKAEIERLMEKYKHLDANIEKIQITTKAEAIKEFAERLCEGRVSNDPVVIAAKCELKEMTGDNDAEE